MSLEKSGVPERLARVRGLRRREIPVVRREVVLNGLAAGLDGFRIVQVSDIHLEPFTTPADVSRVVDVCNGLRPDMVALTGDFVTNHVRPAGELAERLAGLRASAGVFACLGNHDFWSDAPVVERALRQAGVDVLRGETKVLRRGVGELRVAGFDSRYVQRPRWRAGLEGWEPGQALVVLMHEPDVADDLAGAGVAALQLSGHTHGGQLRLPGREPMQFRRARWGKKYLSGAYRVGPVQLHVNRGIGCVGLPLRFFCPPEVTEITLRSPELF